VKNKPIILIIILSLGLVLLSSCSGIGEKDTEQSAQEMTATPTEAPMAARVNGEGILLAEFESELQRYQSGAASAEIEVPVEKARQDVLDFLVEQTLFKQAAVENGYVASQEEISARLAELADARGGQAGLDAYLAENFYTAESFRSALARDLAVIWMRNFLISQIPTTTEQVHARQILLDSQNAAIAVVRQLEVGTPFAELAFGYGPLTGGELGWFPRGYLFQPAVEEAAFALQPGQFSGIIETSYGFHIIEVIERDPQRALSADALLAAQRTVIETWLTDRRAQSAIEIYVN
jgi:parvulin-like peptidyl-prolyl isomerase